MPFKQKESGLANAVDDVAPHDQSRKGGEQRGGEERRREDRRVGNSRGWRAESREQRGESPTVVAVGLLPRAEHVVLRDEVTSDGVEATAQEHRRQQIGERAPAHEFDEHEVERNLRDPVQRVPLARALDIVAQVGIESSV
jgi:hypothetical protein